MAKYVRKKTRRMTEEEELESAYESLAGKHRRSKKAVRQHRLGAIIASIAAGVAICLCLFAAFTFFQNAELDGIILENVQVAGVDVGGMTQADAIEAVRAATAKSYSHVPMVVQVLEHTAEIPVSYAGQLDVRAAVKAAYKFGQSGSQSKQEQERKLLQDGAYAIDITPYLSLNETGIREILAQLGQHYNTTLKQSSYTLTGEAPNQTLEIQMGIPEYGLDLNALYQQVLDNYSSNTFRTEGQCGMITPDEVDLDAIYIETYIAPVDATYDPESNTVTQSKDGYGFDLENAKNTLANTDFGETVKIKLKAIPPAVSSENISAMLFRDVLSTYTAKSDSDKDRDVNLRLACEAINGLVLNPGDVFSYNDTLGERTEARGYRPGPSYAGNKTVYTIGGGICQVSSALYYCAVQSEMKIVTRKNHGLMPAYMPVGLDATVNWGTIDFCFQNDSDYPVRIEASAKGGKITVSLIGTEVRDYTVKLESDILSKTDYKTTYETMSADNPDGYKDGDVITQPYTGYEVDTYLVKYSNETGDEIDRQLIAHSTYRKRDAVVCKIETIQ